MILLSLRYNREMDATLSEDDQGPYLLVDQQRVVRPAEEIALSQFRILECEKWEQQALEEAGFNLKTLKEALEELESDAGAAGGGLQGFPPTPPPDDDDPFY